MCILGGQTSTPYHQSGAVEQTDIHNLALNYTEMRAILAQFLMLYIQNIGSAARRIQRIHGRVLRTQVLHKSFLGGASCCSFDNIGSSSLYTE